MDNSHVQTPNSELHVHPLARFFLSFTPACLRFVPCHCRTVTTHHEAANKSTGFCLSSRVHAVGSRSTACNEGKFTVLQNFLSWVSLLRSVLLTLDRVCACGWGRRKPGRLWRTWSCWWWPHPGSPGTGPGTTAAAPSRRTSRSSEPERIRVWAQRRGWSLTELPRPPQPHWWGKFTGLRVSAGSDERGGAVRVFVWVCPSACESPLVLHWSKETEYGSATCERSTVT